MDEIIWPKEGQIIYRQHQAETLQKIQSLFYRTGTAFTTVYLLVVLVLQPMLQQLYDQRLDFTAVTVLELRKLVSTLQRRLRANSTSVLGFPRDDGCIERATQTSEDGQEGDLVVSNNWIDIQQRLQGVTHELRVHNNMSSLWSQLDDTKLQLNLLAGQAKGYSTVKEASFQEITRTLREIKGWFINGVLPS